MGKKVFQTPDIATEGFAIHIEVLSGKRNEEGIVRVFRRRDVQKEIIKLGVCLVVIYFLVCRGIINFYRQRRNMFFVQGIVTVRVDDGVCVQTIVVIFKGN